MSAPIAATRALSRFALVALLGSLAGLALGCATAENLLRPAPAPESEAWQLPAESYPTQRLYRVRYDGPEGKLSFRLTLYLVADGHYRIEAADTLGRRVWSLGLEPDGRAIFLDHRAEVYCRSFASRGQNFVPIAHLPLEFFPHLLLGRLPAEPADPRAAEVGGGKLVIRDAAGQTWQGQLGEEGRLAWWSLLQSGDAVAWWKWIDGESVFSDRRGGQQVRWKEQVREALGTPPAPLEIPDAYREGVCVPVPSDDTAR